MKLLTGVAELILSVEQLVEGIRNKKAVALFAGIVLALASGVCFFLAVKSGELEIKFGEEAEDEEAEDFLD